MIFLMYPLFILVLNSNINTQFIAQSVISLMIGMFVGPLAIFSADLFPTQIRYTGISLSLNISAAIFGGTTPLICSWLARISNNANAPVYYFISVAVLAFIVINFIKPTQKQRSPI